MLNCISFDRKIIFLLSLGQFYHPKQCTAGRRSRPSVPGSHSSTMPGKKRPWAGAWTDAEDQVIRDEMAKDGSLKLKLASMHKLLPHRTFQQFEERYQQLGLGRQTKRLPWSKDEHACILPIATTLSTSCIHYCRRCPGSRPTPRSLGAMAMRRP